MLRAFLSKPRLKTIWTMSNLMSYDCVEKLVIEYSSDFLTTASKDRNDGLKSLKCLQGSFKTD